MNNKVSIFGGTGYVGTNYFSMYPHDSILIPRNQNHPASNKVLYFISTTDNYNIFSKDPTVDVNTNLVKLIHVLEDCKNKNIKEFNFISSWFVYGDCPMLPVKESFIKKPKGLYSITKSCAEEVVQHYCEMFGISWRIFRLCSVYGGNDSGTRVTKNALQFVAKSIKDNKETKLNWGGEFLRDYMHVYDVCRAINHLMMFGNHNEIYNIGSGYAYKFIDLVNIIYDIIGSERNILSVEPSEQDKLLMVKDISLDIMKLGITNFDSKSNVDIRSGIQDMINKI